MAPFLKPDLNCAIFDTAVRMLIYSDHWKQTIKNSTLIATST